MERMRLPKIVLERVEREVQEINDVRMWNVMLSIG